MPKIVIYRIMECFGFKGAFKDHLVSTPVRETPGSEPKAEKEQILNGGYILSLDGK